MFEAEEEEEESRERETLKCNLLYILKTYFVHILTMYFVHILTIYSVYILTMSNFQTSDFLLSQHKTWSHWLNTSLPLCTEGGNLPDHPEKCSRGAKHPDSFRPKDMRGQDLIERTFEYFLKMSRLLL